MAKLSISESSPVGVEGGTLAENIARYGRRWSGAGISPSLTDSLAADLEADYVLIPKADLPEVVKREDGHFENGDRFYHRAAPFRQIALEHLAIAEYQESARVVEEAKLTKRRDELAAEYTAVPTYSGQLPYTQRLIDRIIQEQDRAAERDREKA